MTIRLHLLSKLIINGTIPPLYHKLYLIPQDLPPLSKCHVADLGFETYYLGGVINSRCHRDRERKPIVKVFWRNFNMKIVVHVINEAWPEVNGLNSGERSGVKQNVCREFCGEG